MSKSRGSMSKNPLLGASGTFSLDSPALLVPAATAPSTLPLPPSSSNSGVPPNNINSIPLSAPSAREIPNNATNHGSISNLFAPTSANSIDPFANVGLNNIVPTDGLEIAFDNGSTMGVAGSESSQQSVKSLSPCSSNAAIYGGSPFPSNNNMNPPSSVFLLPASTTSTSSSALPPSSYINNPSVLTSPPTFTVGEGSSLNRGNTGGINLRKSRYVAPPGINSISSVPPSMSASTMPMSPSASNLPTFVPDAIPNNVNPSIPLHFSSSTPDFSQGMHVPPPPRELDADVNQYPGIVQKTLPSIPDLVYHWFYLCPRNDPVPSYLEAQPHSQSSIQPSLTPQSKYEREVWKPFSMIDSVAIEDAFTSGHNDDLEPIPTDGGRYDVNISKRTKTAVYWSENEPTPIRRCSWFYHSNVDGRWVPYEEQLAARLEEEYRSAHQSGQWGTKLEIAGGEYITLHSASVMMHFPTATPSTLDDWGQVQPPQDPMLKPRIVHRGLEGLPEIPDGETPGEVDHLIFVIHGIGSACDMKLRSIVSVTDCLRELTADMSERHFSFAHLSSKASRVEFLPVNWHKTLHGEDEGTDSRLKPITLRTIPKLRGFVNDTLLDVLFYTSPMYCQKILNTVTSEINRMYTLFMARNEKFKGEVSFIGHSLGSLIMFDTLCNQTEKADMIESSTVCDATNTELICGSENCDGLNINISEATVEQLFVNLGIEVDLATPFVREGIDIEALMTCGEEDLKEGGLPLGPRKRLLAFFEGRKGPIGAGGMGISGLEAFIRASSIEEIKYTVGPAGTGQPSVKYPQLVFKVSSFYALGSPIGMFMAVRGIDTLGPDFKLPTCERFFNIFHPFDPVAYRMEALIKKEYGMSLRPVTIPHHKGRKRMHLELRDTVTKLMTSDFKQKVIDSVSAAIGTFYNMATGTQQRSDEQMVEQMVQQEISKKDRESPDSEERNPKKMDSQLNQGNRIDFVLQEAPFESFNEYVFALGSHLCYWESEDTCLMILKDIYTQMGVNDDLSQSVQGIKSPSPSMTEFPRPPTAILAPPPTPLGGPMVGPPVQVSYTTPTAIIAPPPTPLGGPMLGPSVPVVKIDKKIYAGDSQAPRVGSISTTGPILPATPSSITPTLITPANITSSGPPPPMMNLASGEFGSGPPPSKSYPKPMSHPSRNTENKSGMDPTAPISAKSVPIGPPPAGGFVMRK